MKSRVILLLVACVCFSACTPKKVQQGNLLPKSRVERLQVGMTKEQVERIMGSSLLVTPFSDNHWDYVYTKQVGHGPIEKKHLVLDFEGDALTHIDY